MQKYRVTKEQLEEKGFVVNPNTSGNLYMHCATCQKYHYFYWMYKAPTEFTVPEYVSLCEQCNTGEICRTIL